jgi:hypothetical protein
MIKTDSTQTTTVDVIERSCQSETVTKETSESSCQYDIITPTNEASCQSELKTTNKDIQTDDNDYLNEEIG